MKKILIPLFLLCLSVSAHAQQVFMQGWYWDYPKTAAGSSWADTLRLKAPELHTAGITHIWFPPHAIASFGTNSNGYDPKDLFIGNQTSGLGTRTALDNMLTAFAANNIAPVADLIYNHRDGGTSENNSAVKEYITNQYTAAKEPYPSDRFRCILPVGGSTGNGAGDYYFKLSSKSGAARFNGYTYKLYMQTNTTGYAGLPAQTEAEPNGGGDCGQGNNLIQLGRDMFGTVETGGSCNTDEFHLVLNASDFNAAGDTIFIYMNNTGGYSDHRFYGIYSAPASSDIVNQLQYQTYTNFNNMPSGRGQMNFEFFKPNSANVTSTYLNGDWDGMYFFYDYDQFQKRTQDTLIAWTKWNWDELGVRGLRMDAVKHFTPEFVGHMLDSMHTYGKDPSLVVGEWYSTNPSELSGWVSSVKANMSAGAQAAIQPKIFDFALREKLRQASDESSFDTRDVFTSSLHDAAGMNGVNIITFANNHDFRDASGFASLIRNNNNLAYVYLLTNNQLGVPTIFYPDYYGYPAPAGGLYGYHPTNLPALKPEINSLIYVLKTYINGSPSVDYLNRYSTPYTSNYISGSANKALIYQLQGTVANGNKDVLVAINYGDVPLKLDHQINNHGGAIPQGTQFTDVLGRSAFPFQVVNASGSVYFELPAKSYSVWVQGSVSVVPLSLVSFTAQPAEEKTDLFWKATSEINADRYEVQRSINSLDFATLGNVVAKNINEANYNFTDSKLPKAEVLYYRLKIVDKAGSFTYSDVLKVKRKTASFSVAVSPNPVAANDPVSLTIETGKSSNFAVTIFNAAGQKFYSKSYNLRAGATRLQIPADKMPAGNYSVVVTDGIEKINQSLIKY
jgi:hypothetical protein